MQERIGLGAQKLGLDPHATREQRIKRNREMLYRVLNLHTTVAFVGAGCSVPLGYPTWKTFAEKAVAHSSEVLQAMPQNDAVNADIQRLKRFQMQLASGVFESLPFILGACQRILLSYKKETDYFDFLRLTFEPPKSPCSSPNPFYSLLRLPIKRFITSNYDSEIEKALSHKRRIAPAEFDMNFNRVRARPCRSFTQKDFEQLALFAMARVDDADNLVFHCHGHYEDADSMVVTESDYQRWYLADSTESSEAFRQTIALIFSSNPILFVGYGLSGGDDDLLRFLRMLVAVAPEQKHSRSLFALLPEEREGEDEDHHEALYDRYAVKVIPYASPNLQNRGQDLCNALSLLHDEWIDWWDGLLQKPRMRKVQIDKQVPAPYHHYPMFGKKRLSFGGQRFQQMLDELQEDAETGKKVIGIIGPGGTGKSWCAQKLMERVQNPRSGFQGYFFWSSYYSNDALTGLDRALNYLDRDHKIPGPRLTRFVECLRRGRYFIVFDGIERLLRETDNPQEGRGFNPIASELMKLIGDSKSQSTVVITSRLWPEELNASKPTKLVKEYSSTEDFSSSNLRPGVKMAHIVRFTVSDVEAIEPFSWLKEKQEISALCSLLDGHVYCLTLAAEMLRRTGKQQAQTRLKKIRRALSDTLPDRRTSRMIREAMADIDADWQGMASRMLERLAVFMSPVGKQTLDICYESALATMTDLPAALKDKNRLIEALISSNLLHQVINSREEEKPSAYTLHPIVAGYIFQRLHKSSSDALPDFTLPGFTAGTAIVDPGASEGVEIVTDIFDRLENSADRARKEGKELEAISLCRSAFGVVRSRMSSNTVPRWTTYDAYIQIVIRLADLAKNVSPRVWDYAERTDVRAVEDPQGPLYADELAWIYNEIGLTSYGEGAMLNALAVWEQGYEINKVIDSYQEGGNYLFQSQCNLGAGFIHYGRLDIAQRYLHDAEQTNYRLQDQDHAGRIVGYQGLVQHLSGDFKQADRLYEKALKMLKKAGGNPRAESIFLRHLGDLKIELGEQDTAKLLIQSSRSIAEANRYPDLVAYARMAYGHWYRAQKDFPAALHEYKAALQEARLKGIRRLESEALSELSRLALDMGDAQIARQRAIEALRIANECVLGLRQTHGLVVLGKATIQAGQRDLGVAYLKHAKMLADRQRYWMRGSEAEEELQKVGESSQENPRKSL
jgi:hypothetical protein